MKIVLLEGNSVGEDMVFTPFFELGEVDIYPATSVEEMPERIKDADIIFFLDEGKIIDQVSFDDLYNTNEKFKSMFLAENI